MNLAGFWLQLMHKGWGAIGGPGGSSCSSMGWGTIGGSGGKGLSPINCITASINPAIAATITNFFHTITNKADKRKKQVETVH